jgi:hypothetical protein
MYGINFFTKIKLISMCNNPARQGNSEETKHSKFSIKFLTNL